MEKEAVESNVPNLKFIFNDGGRQTLQTVKVFLADTDPDGLQVSVKFYFTEQDGFINV